MSEVTTLFKSLSQEVLRLTGTFEDAGLKEVVCILKELQQVEMEKLELLVKWQLMSRQEDSEEEVEDFGAALHQKRELKKKLVRIFLKGKLYHLTIMKYIFYVCNYVI